MQGKLEAEEGQAQLARGRSTAWAPDFIGGVWKKGFPKSWAPRETKICNAFRLELVNQSVLSIPSTQFIRATKVVYGGG